MEDCDHPVYSNEERCATYMQYMQLRHVTNVWKMGGGGRGALLKYILNESLLVLNNISTKKGYKPVRGHAKFMGYTGPVQFQN